MLSPQYKGSVSPTLHKCFCKKNIGKVWWWIPPVQGAMHKEGMAAHTKCFRNLWKGEY